MGIIWYMQKVHDTRDVIICYYRKDSVDQEYSFYWSSVSADSSMTNNSVRKQISLNMVGLKHYICSCEELSLIDISKL